MVGDFFTYWFKLKVNGLSASVLGPGDGLAIPSARDIAIFDLATLMPTMQDFISSPHCSAS